MLIIIFPVSDVNISVEIYQSAVAAIYSGFPPSIESGSIWIYLHTSAILFIINPFAFIQILILISNELPIYSVLISIIRLSTPIKLSNIIQYSEYNIWMKFGLINLQIVSHEFILPYFHTVLIIIPEFVGISTAALV